MSRAKELLDINEKSLEFVSTVKDISKAAQDVTKTYNKVVSKLGTRIFGRFVDFDIDNVSGFVEAYVMLEWDELIKGTGVGEIKKEIENQLKGFSNVSVEGASAKSAKLKIISKL
jgi:hypothetical protein